MLGNFACFCCSVLTFFLLFFKFFMEHYQSVKRVRSRRGLMFCQSWSWSKLLAKVIKEWQTNQWADEWTRRKQHTLLLLLQKKNKLQQCMFVSILYILVNNFQSCWDRSSLVVPVLSTGYSVLLKDTTQCLRWCSNPQPFSLKSSTLPLNHHAPPLAMFDKDP